ncbi:MAG: WbqC family protein [Flavobacteriales bacterium]
MSELVVLPICPFGNVKWWTHFLSTERVQLNGYEYYQKQTWRNRYDILGANGKQSLTIPISKPSGEKVKTKDLQLFHETHWKKVHWRSIKSAYGSSPFWIYYSDQIEELFKKEFTSLQEFSLASIKLIIEELQLDKEVHIALQKAEESSLDFSKDFKPSKCDFKNKAYLQVFDDRFPFHENLSVLDVLFNLGPEAEGYLRSLN